METLKTHKFATRFMRIRGNKGKTERSQSNNDKRTFLCFHFHFFGTKSKNEIMTVAARPSL